MTAHLWLHESWPRESWPRGWRVQTSGAVLLLFLLSGFPNHALGELPSPPMVVLDTRFEPSWFESTEDYRALVAAGAKKGVTKKMIDDTLARVEVSERYIDWVARYASPMSRRRQKKRVRSVMHILLSKERLALGARFADEHAEILRDVSTKYEVDVPDLLAMLNAESKFGAVQGDFVVATVFVANMAYLSAAERSKKPDYALDGALSRARNLKRVEKRKRYARRNLVTLLAYAKSRQLDPMSMTGSWAGAIGMTQFMPASMRYAADGDGDGVIDLSQVPDAVSSTANYLVKHGYVRGDLKARRKAFMAYNPNKEYVNAIVAYADRYAERVRAAGSKSN